MKLSNSSLKIIAILSMIIDHIGIVLFSSSSYYLVFRAIGRVSFPIFIFLLIEGFTKTRNINKYTFNLFIFALISEIPFDLVFNNSGQNIFFTLFFGVLMLRSIEYFKNNKDIDLICFIVFYLFLILASNSVIFSTFIILIIYKFLKTLNISFNSIGIFFIFTLISILFNTDYAGVGIVAIYISYLFKEYKIISALLVCLIVSVYSPICLISIISIILIYFYNNERGINLKYLFYIIYPLHLIILYIIS